MSRRTFRSAPQPALQFDKSTVTWRDEVHREHGHQFLVPSSVDAVMPEFVNVMNLNDDKVYALFYGICSLASGKIGSPGRQKSAAAIRRELGVVAAGLKRIEGILAGHLGGEVRRGLVREPSEKTQKEIQDWLSQIPAMSKLAFSAAKQNHNMPHYKSLMGMSEISKSQAVAELATLYAAVTGKPKPSLRFNGIEPKVGGVLWFVQKAAAAALVGELTPNSISDLFKSSKKKYKID
jgi:hypothetical protein